MIFNMILSIQLYTRRQYDSVLSSIVDKHAPPQTKTVIQRPAAPWYSEEIATEKTQRRKLERRWRHSGLLTDRQTYVTQCLLLKNLIFTTKMDYYSSLIDDAGSDSKALFRNINRLLHRKPDKLYPSCTSASDLANNFANFFTEKIKVKNDPRSEFSNLSNWKEEA